MVLAWDIVDLGVTIWSAQQYGAHLAAVDKDNMLSFVIICAIVIAPGFVLICLSVLTFVDYHRLHQSKRPLCTRSNHPTADSRVRSINRHVRREVAYDLLQMFAFGYIQLNFKFTDNEFPLKKAIDFCNIMTTVIDAFVLKGYVVCKALGDPNELREIFLAFLNEDDNDDDDDADRLLQGGP